MTQTRLDQIITDVTARRHDPLERMQSRLDGLNDRLGRLESRFAVLTWMVGLNVALIKTVCTSGPTAGQAEAGLA